MAKGEKANMTDKERIRALEDKLARLWWAYGAIVAGVVLFAGVGLYQVPELAKDKAIAAATPVAQKAAEDEVKKKVPQTVETLIAELEGLKIKASAAVAETEQARVKVLATEKSLSGNVADTLRKEFNDKLSQSEQKFLKLDPTGGVEVLGSLKVKGSATVEQDFSARGVKAKTFDGRVLVIRDEKEGATIRLGEEDSEPLILWYFQGVPGVKGGTRGLRLGKDGKWVANPFVIQPLRPGS